MIPLALIFCNLLYLFCVKLFSPSEIICAIPTMCTPYYESRLILVSEIFLMNILSTHLFGMRCHCYILVEIIYWEFYLMYVDIVISKAFNLNKHFFPFLFVTLYPSWVYYSFRRIIYPALKNILLKMKNILLYIFLLEIWVACYVHCFGSD